MKASKKVVSVRQRSAATALRHRLTDTERRLWHALRARVPIDGSHFRRQVSIDRFIVDFCCHRAKIIIEVDGSQHGFEGERRRDAVRTAALEAEGYKVLRFWNWQVWQNLDAVLETIFAVGAERTGSPSPYAPDEDVVIPSKRRTPNK